jgi:hypothetical protein
MTDISHRPAWFALAVAATVNVAVGIPVYLWAGLSHYFMNDLPSRDDNLSYLRWGVAAAVVSTLLLMLLSVTDRRLSWRVVAFAAGMSAAINGVFLAFSFGTDVDGLGDDSGTTYGAMMATSTVRSLAAGCAAVAALGLMLAVLGRPSRARRP